MQSYALLLAMFTYCLSNFLARINRHFMATDAKMLRVAMSTTYDMINVALKCFQEFEDL